MRRFFVGLVNTIATIAVSPCIASCWVSKILHPSGAEVFRFWGQLLAFAPGLPGMVLRRAFYRFTLTQCDWDCYIGFGTQLSHPEVKIESGVYIGNLTMLGHVNLRRGCMIGSRVSILSGKNQHSYDRQNGKWLHSNIDNFKQVEIGADAWIGEGAIVMADVGRASAVGAGAVVTKVLPEYVIAAGNPARLVRQLDVPRSRDCS